MSVALEELLQVDPGRLVIGPNVRFDTLPDAREFAASIKARGVLEVITAYRDGDGHLVVLRGQRRAVVAARVGTPTGTVTVRVVAAPVEADRITDQMTENLHRAGMAKAEIRDGIEQLALCGVSAAQIAKRTAITRSTVDAALIVAAHPATRTRMDADGLTLDQAAIFAEFDDDPTALEELTLALQWRRPLEHTAQRLRDATAEHAAITAEAARLRAAGLPALDPADTPDNVRVLRLDAMVTDVGQPVPETDWPTVPGAAVAVVQEWRYPATDHADSDRANEVAADRVGAARNLEVVSDPVSMLVPVWICTDPAAAGLRYRYDYLAGRTGWPGSAVGRPRPQVPRP